MDAANVLQPIPLSALQHYSYCPRQYALIHLEQVFEDNEHTLRGQAVHQRVDQPANELRKDGVRVVRSLSLFHDELGLTGRADVVEFNPPDGQPVPVEYKHGPRRQHQHDDLQLAAQALCLEYMTGKAVPMGMIFHASSKRRREVPLTAQLRQDVLAAIAAIRAIETTKTLPPPVNDARCAKCSLKDACQPELLSAKSTLSQLRASLFDIPPHA